MENKNITISLFSNTAWSIFNFRRGLIAAMQASGYTVSVVAPPDNVYVPLLEAMGCTVTQIPMDNMGVSVWRDGLLWLRYLRYLLTARPQVVILFTIKPVIYGATVSRFLRIKSICVITGLGTAFIQDSWLKRFVSFLYKIALKFPDRIFFLNKEDLELFLSSDLLNNALLLPGEGVDLKEFSDINIIPNDIAKYQLAEVLPGSGINLNYFFEKFDPSLTKNSSELVFLLIARMIRDKGIVEFVNAAKLLKINYPSVRFQLLGFVGVKNKSAISQDEIDEWVYSGAVEYLGVAQDVRPFLNNADCIVLPSYREGVPRTLLEAAAMSKPIVTTDVPGCRDVVEDNVNGFLCQPHDSKDLANKMELMINLSPSRRKEMGENGREKMVREFDEHIVIDKYLTALTEISHTLQPRYR